MQIDPATIPARDRYKLLIGGIVPRPIAVVSTISPDGRTNLAPFSFFAGVGSEPMALLFCPANGPDGDEKDTLRNAKPVAEGGTGEFVVHVATEGIVRQVVAAAEPLPYGESEFERLALDTTPSSRVRPLRWTASPIAFECVTRQVTRLAPGIPAGGNVVLGEVVAIHLDDALVDGRFRIDPALLAAVGRMGGFGYCRTVDRFELPAGLEALSRPDPFAG